MLGWIDLCGLLTPAVSIASVRNGTADKAGSGRLFVPGKQWPSLDGIELVPPP